MMKRHAANYAILVAAAAVVMLTNLGATRLWDQDEAYFAGSALEMYGRGEWLVPYFNGELYSHKPPLMYWMMMLGFQVFGITSLAVRIGSAVFGMATVLLTYHLGCRLFSSRVGLWAGLIMSSSLMFDVVARAATPDSYLVFFSTLSLYVFVAGGLRGAGPCDAASRPGEPSGGSHAVLGLPGSWKTFAWMYGIMGVAVLAKGPIGVLLPMAVIGLFLLCTTPAQGRWAPLHRFGPRNFFRCLWQMRPLTAAAMVLLVAGPWYGWVAWQTQGEFLWEFFGVHNVGRFLEPMDNHRGPLVYYIPAILVGFFPWSIFILPTLVDLTSRIRSHGRWHQGALLLACWVGVYVGFFSLASTKLPSYVLPAYPALALMTGCFLAQWIGWPQSVHRGWPRAAFGVLAVLGLATLVSLPLVSQMQVNGEPLLARLGVSAELNAELPWMGLLGLVPLAGALLCLLLSHHGRPAQAAAAMALTAVLFTTSLLGVAAVRIDRYQTSETFAHWIHQLSPDQPARIGQHRYFRPSLIYYSRQRVEPCNSPEAVEQFFAAWPQGYLVTTVEKYEQLRARLPEEVVVLGQQPQFPKKGNVVLLGRGESLPWAVATEANPPRATPPPQAARRGGAGWDVATGLDAGVSPSTSADGRDSPGRR